jgi:hypothetical protein
VWMPQDGVVALVMRTLRRSLRSPTQVHTPKSRRGSAGRSRSSLGRRGRGSMASSRFGGRAWGEPLLHQRVGRGEQDATAAADQLVADGARTVAMLHLGSPNGGDVVAAAEAREPQRVGRSLATAEGRGAQSRVARGFTPGNYSARCPAVAEQEVMGDGWRPREVVLPRGDKAASRVPAWRQGRLGSARVATRPPRECPRGDKAASGVPAWRRGRRGEWTMIGGARGRGGGR